MVERSLARGRPAIVVVLLGVWLVLAPWAGAAPAFAPPSGWSEGGAANEQARRRADAWALAWNADVRQVMSTRADDGFAETLAILDVAAPIPAEVLTDLDAARTWLAPRVTAALGTSATLDPDGLELRPRPERGVAVLVAHVRQDDRLVRIAVAPHGVRHLAVVLMLPEAEAVLYAGVFDDAVDGLEGLQPPVTPLRRGLLRTVALLSWLLVGSGFAFAWTRRSLPDPGARVAGRQVAAALVATSALVLVLAGWFLGDAAVELALAGSAPWSFALELALGGVVMAVLVLVATELWERRVRPIASAPESGTFAVPSPGSRRAGSSMSVPIVPVRPAVTGDTHVGPPPAVTGNTQVGPAPTAPPPAITGDTHVGRPPAVTGNTKVGPAPQPVVIAGADPPVREIISGDIEVQTQVRRAPEPDTVKTAAPQPDTVKTAAPQPAREQALPKLEIDWS